MSIEGFAKMPHRITAEPELSDAAYRVFGSLLRFARSRGECSPTNREIGAATGGKSPRSVQFALRELETIGLIATRRDPATNFRSKILISDLPVAMTTEPESAPPPRVESRRGGAKSCAPPASNPAPPQRKIPRGGAQDFDLAPIEDHAGAPAELNSEEKNKDQETNQERLSGRISNPTGDGDGKDRDLADHPGRPGSPGALGRAPILPPCLHDPAFPPPRGAPRPGPMIPPGFEELCRSADRIAGRIPGWWFSGELLRDAWSRDATLAERWAESPRFCWTEALYAMAERDAAPDCPLNYYLGTVKRMVQEERQAVASHTPESPAKPRPEDYLPPSHRPPPSPEALRAIEVEWERGRAYRLAYQAEQRRLREEFEAKARAGKGGRRALA